MEVTKILIQHSKIEPNLQNNRGFDALIRASEKGHPTIVKQLLGHPSIELNQQTLEKEQCSLMFASHRGYCKIVELLLAHTKIQVNVQAFEGRTALMMAALKGHSKVVELLVSHTDIDVNMQDDVGS